MKRRKKSRGAVEQASGHFGQEPAGKGGSGLKIRRCIFLALWMLSLAAITFFGGTVSYGLFWGMTLLPVVSVTYIAFVYFRFKVYQEIGNRSMVCGQPETWFFVLQNEDRFAFTSVSVRLFSDFSYVEELPGDVEYELLPGDRFTFETKLVCRYRGEYEVGIRDVTVTDFLGIFRVRYDNPGIIKALVSPRIVPLTELKCLGEFQALLRRETFRENEPDVVVRDYMPGDPLKQIHWKATARERKLKTRTRKGEEKQGISIFCDMTRWYRDRKQYLPVENKMLEVLLALGFFFAGRDTGFTAYYGQQGLVRQQVRGMEDFDGFYRKTADVAFGPEEEPGTLLARLMAGEGLWDSKACFLVLHRPDRRILEMTEYLALGGVMTVICLVSDQFQESYIGQNSERRKIVRVPIEADLEGVL